MVVVCLIEIRDDDDVDFFRALPRFTVFAVRPRFRFVDDSDGVFLVARALPLFFGKVGVDRARDGVGGLLRLRLLCFSTVDIARLNRSCSSFCFFLCLRTDCTLAFRDANFLNFRGGSSKCLR